MLRQVVGRSSTGLLAGSQCVLGQCSRWVTARCSASAPRGRLRATPIQATTAPTDRAIVQRERYNTMPSKFQQPKKE